MSHLSPVKDGRREQGKFETLPDVLGTACRRVQRANRVINATDAMSTSSVHHFRPYLLLTFNETLRFVLIHRHVLHL